MSEELAKRAVACLYWRWLPGMRSEPDSQRCYWRMTVRGWQPEEGPEDACQPDGSLLPDLDDPATIGCLLHLVREAWHDDELSPYVCPNDSSRKMFRCGGRGLGWEAFSEAELLVEALEDAP